MLFNTVAISVRCLRCAKVSPSQSIKMLTQTRNYASWIHRTPVAVVNEEIVLNEAEVAEKPRKYVNEDTEHYPLKPKTRKRPGQARHPVPVIRSNATFKDDGTLNYATIMDDDRKLSVLMINLKSKKMREKNQQIVLEGRRLITDAINAGLKLNIVLFSRASDVLKMPLPQEDVQLFKVPYKTMQLWSSLTTTPGVMAIFEQPKSFEKEPPEDSIPLTIICDNVREPGNLGSILRASAGVGCERVILTKGCVDLWDAKVLRSAAGAHFRVSISNGIEWEDVRSLISPSAKTFAADNNVTLSSEIEAIQPIAGVQKESGYSSSDDEDDADSTTSLNAKSEIPHEASESIEKTIEKSSESSGTETKMEDGKEVIREVSAKELSSLIPVIPYYAADYSKNEVVLIVGGETHGLSYEGIELIRETGGARVNVPLTNNVDSLNTGMALGIVAFEIKKQFLIRKNNIVKQGTT